MEVKNAARTTLLTTHTTIDLRSGPGENRPVTIEMAALLLEFGLKSSHIVWALESLAGESDAHPSYAMFLDDMKKSATDPLSLVALLDQPKGPDEDFAGFLKWTTDELHFPADLPPDVMRDPRTIGSIGPNIRAHLETVNSRLRPTCLSRCPSVVDLAPSSRPAPKRDTAPPTTPRTVDSKASTAPSN